MLTYVMNNVYSHARLHDIFHHYPFCFAVVYCYLFCVCVFFGIYLSQFYNVLIAGIVVQHVHRLLT